MDRFGHAGLAWLSNVEAGGRPRPTPAYRAVRGFLFYRPRGIRGGGGERRREERRGKAADGRAEGRTMPARPQRARRKGAFGGTKSKRGRISRDLIHSYAARNVLVRVTGEGRGQGRRGRRGGDSNAHSPWIGVRCVGVRDRAIGGGNEVRITRVRYGTVRYGTVR